jgi:putative transposase
VTLELRRRHPPWRPKKLFAWLRKRWPEERIGKVWFGPRKVRRRRPYPGRLVTSATASTELWSADFKGQFRTLDWDGCYPLTIADL